MQKNHNLCQPNYQITDSISHNVRKQIFLYESTCTAKSVYSELDYNEFLVIMNTVLWPNLFFFLNNANLYNKLPL